MDGQRVEIQKTKAKLTVSDGDVNVRCHLAPSTATLKIVEGTHLKEGLLYARRGFVISKKELIVELANTPRLNIFKEEHNNYGMKVLLSAEDREFLSTVMVDIFKEKKKPDIVYL